MTHELCDEKGISFDEEAFEKEAKKHQELSRTAATQKFKGGLADANIQTTKLHTATHLLNEALRKILQDDTIKQRGSNITQERLRFDFNFSRKLTPQEIGEIEKLINEKIDEQIPVLKTEMPLAEALASGAQSEFGARYPELLTVYSIGDFSKEICGGPHVANTGGLGYITIIKEESCGAGLRRIKASLNG
jgi:alanyl-tRNA synthetase